MPPYNRIADRIMCKLCGKYATRRFSLGACAQHPNHLCTECFDKHVLHTVSKNRAMAVRCKQCGSTMTEDEVEMRMSRPCYKIYKDIEEHFESLAAKEKEEAAKAADEEGFVLVDKEDVVIEMEGRKKGDKKGGQRGPPCTCGNSVTSADAEQSITRECLRACFVTKKELSAAAQKSEDDAEMSDE
ncbi:hypothetical protein CERZMDRAFT_100427 [Cercospora zeae-maydis SCOH1-5]|uniref:Uncharacterized protein n=1 Tax=Cercospora zeae-maydis SCOH1-5 TaxID=717836 RepID=A0A6A6F7Z4_9PEZI|nr:hypothetical protein CERZMDRAFT_100427 [Cercospora zeae-maydis SCOH1-5]